MTATVGMGVRPPILTYSIQRGGRTGRPNTLAIAVYDGWVSADAILERSEPKRLNMLRELNVAETVVNPLFRHEFPRCL